MEFCTFTNFVIMFIAGILSRDPERSSLQGPPVHHDQVRASPAAQLSSNTNFTLFRVCRKVAFDFQSNVPGDYVMHEKKQIPCVTSMLTRDVLFTRK